MYFSQFLDESAYRIDHKIRCNAIVNDDGIAHYCSGAVFHTEGTHWHCHACGRRYHDNEVSQLAGW